MTHRIEMADGSVLHVESPLSGAQSAAVLPLISLTISFRVGGTSDPDGKDGLLRLMLRLMRRGSKNRSASEIDDLVDRLGAEVSVEVAPTSSTLHAQVVSRNVDPFVDLLAELLAHPAFDETELERLRRETEAELQEARDSDRGLANLWFRRAVFEGDPYARSANGRLSSLATLTAADVRAAYTELVRKGNVVVGICGDITLEKAEAVHARLLAELPEGASSPRALPEARGPIGRSLIFVDKPERSQTQILVGRLGTHPHDPDHVALSLANTAFGGTFTARLMQEIRAKRGWSYGAYARLAIEQRRHAFSMWTFPAAEQAAECLALQLSLWQAFYDAGINKREHRFFKNYLDRSYAFEIDTAQKRLSQSVDLDLLRLPADYYTGYLAHLAAVTQEDANAAVRARLDPKDLVVVVVGTADTTYEAVRAAIPNLDASRIERFDAE